MIRRRPTTYAAPLLAAALLGGCAPFPRLQAEWRMFEEPSSEGAKPVAAGSSETASDRWAYTPDASGVSVLYVLIHNQDLKATGIAEVALATRNRLERRAEREGGPLKAKFRKEKILFQRAQSAGPFLLQPGDFLPVRIDIHDNSDRRCFLPVHLFVRSDLAKRRVQQVDISAAMPSGLLSQWLYQDSDQPGGALIPSACRDASAEVGSSARTR